MVQQRIYGFTTIVRDEETGRCAGIYPHGTKVVLALRYLHEEGPAAFIPFDAFVEAYSAAVYWVQAEERV